MNSTGVLLLAHIQCISLHRAVTTSNLARLEEQCATSDHLSQQVVVLKSSNILSVALLRATKLINCSVSSTIFNKDSKKLLKRPKWEALVLHLILYKGLSECLWTLHQQWSIATTKLSCSRNFCNIPSTGCLSACVVFWKRKTFQASNTPVKKS